MPNNNRIIIYSPPLYRLSHTLGVELLFVTDGKVVLLAVGALDWVLALKAATAVARGVCSVLHFGDLGVCVGRFGDRMVC